jgi:hypothetical protein
VAAVVESFQVAVVVLVVNMEVAVEEEINHLVQAEQVPQVL